MSKIKTLMFVLIILTSCNSKKEELQVIQTAPTQEVIETTKPTPTTTVEKTETEKEEIVINPIISGGITYNPYDDCFYISTYGEEGENGKAGLDGKPFPFDPPDIERFCRIDSKTMKVTKLLDYNVGYLTYHDSYVYFEDNNILKRIKDDTIEEIYEFPESFYPSIYIENDKVYMMDMGKVIVVYDLENMQEIKDIENYKVDSTQRIYGDIICTVSGDNLYCQKGTGEKKLVMSGFDNYWHYSDYTVYNDSVYYIKDDALHKYDTITKESEMIISFLENDEDSRDYVGYENIWNVKFLNNRCFLFIGAPYSQGAYAELDLETKEVTYLTDYFEDKTNVITASYNYGPFSIEYPNDYNFFMDYGSGGGTTMTNYKKRVRFHMNGLRWLSCWGNDENRFPIGENYLTGVTKQGYTFRYNYVNYENGEEVLQAHIVNNGKSWVMITVTNARENEKEVLDIIKSIHVYEEEMQARIEEVAQKQKEEAEQRAIEKQARDALKTTENASHRN